MYQTPDPQPLGRALSELIARRGLARVGGDRQLEAAWKQVAGERISRMTRPRAIRGGVLQVDVANGAMLGELASFHKRSLLDRLAKEYPELRVQDLKLRLKGDMRTTH